MLGLYRLLVCVGQDVCCGVGCAILVVACGSVGWDGYGSGACGVSFGWRLCVILVCGVWRMRDGMCMLAVRLFSYGSLC